MCIIGTGIECSPLPMFVIGNKMHSMPVTNVNLESKKRNLQIIFFFILHTLEYNQISALHTVLFIHLCSYISELYK
jgi:hypothetical protein